MSIKEKIEKNANIVIDCINRNKQHGIFIVKQLLDRDLALISKSLPNRTIAFVEYNKFPVEIGECYEYYEEMYEFNGKTYLPGFLFRVTFIGKNQDKHKNNFLRTDGIRPDEDGNGKLLFCPDIEAGIYFEQFAKKNILLYYNAENNINPLLAIAGLTTNSIENVESPIYVSLTPDGFIRRDSYNPNTGVLRFSGCEIPIISQKNRKTKLKEPLHGKIMRKLFYKKQTFNHGVEARAVLVIKQSQYESHKKDYDRKIRNAINYLNKKISDKTSVDDLVIFRNSKVYLNEKHLADY